MNWERNWFNNTFHNGLDTQNIWGVTLIKQVKDLYNKKQSIRTYKH